MTTPQQGMTTPQQGMTTPQQGMTTPQQGLSTQQQGTTTSKQGMTTQQQGTTTPKQGAASSVRVYLVLIGAHTGEDDVVLLSALEGVHTGHLNVGVQLLPHGAVAQHHLQHVGALTLVRGDHPELIGGGPTFQEVGHDLLHIGSLCKNPHFVQSLMTELYCVLLLLAPMLHPKMLQDMRKTASECSSWVAAAFHTH